MSSQAKKLLKEIFGKPLPGFGSGIPSQRGVIRYWMWLNENKPDGKSENRILVNSVTKKLLDHCQGLPGDLELKSKDHVGTMVQNLVTKAKYLGNYGQRLNDQDWIQKQRGGFEKPFGIMATSKKPKKSAPKEKESSERVRLF